MSLLALAMIVSWASPPSPQFEIVCEQSVTLSVSSPYSEVKVQATGDLTVAEFGKDLEYWNGHTWMAIAMPTLRFGQHLTAVANGNSFMLRPVRATSAPARLSLSCVEPSAAERQWFLSAQELAERLDQSVPTEADLIDSLRLVAVSVSPRTFPYAKHLQAAVLYRSNRLLEAEADYVVASNAWRQMGTSNLQAAALLSAAHLADRRSDFAVAKARADTAEAIFVSEKLPYFALRAREFSCRQLLREANLVAHMKCLDDLIEGYQGIAEYADEVSLRIDLALALRSFGRTPSLIELERLVRSWPSDRYLNLIVGRYYLLSAQVNLDKGLIDKSLLDFQRAATIFSNVAFDGERWRINAMVQTANLLSNLGLHEQALAVLMQALKIVNAKVAPSRVAAILVALGGALSQAGKFQEASVSYASAAKIQSMLELLQDYSVTTLLQSEVDSRLPIQSSAGTSVSIAHLRSLKAIPAQYQAKNEFLIGRLLLADGKLFESEQQLRNIRVDNLSEPDRNLYAQVKSAQALARGQTLQASSLLTNRLAEIAQTADKAPTSALAYLSVRSGERVRRAWVDMQTTASNPAQLFATAMLANPARFLTSVRSARKNVATAPKQATGDVGFLAQLTGPEARAPLRFSAYAIPSLTELQAQLPQAAQLLILLPGEKQSLALWVGRDQATIRILAGRNALQTAVQEVADALSKPSNPAIAADAALSRLSEMLFHGISADAGAPPQLLWVLADEVTGAIPFAALRWPGAGEPLLTTTALSYATGMRVQSEDEKLQMAHAAAPGLAFFAPSYAVDGQAGAQAIATGVPLARLDFAAMERANVEMQLHRTVAGYTGMAATRAALQDLLQTPGTWLHVAAHGRADPGVLGNAGLWLADPTGKQVADFLSWLELGNLRTQAELLVLNACQSGAGAVPSRQANVSFALALSVGGAKHVVAALWPVSDVASKTWIPVFYHALAASSDAQNSAVGLRQAQLVMYRSPHYRHPFYWASLVHFQRLLF